MDNVVTVSGPFAASPTVRHCDLGGHRLRDGEVWWLVRDFNRGWANGKGAACALHVAVAQATFGDGQLYTIGGLFRAERTRWPQGAHLWLDEDCNVRLAIFLTRPADGRSLRSKAARRASAGVSRTSTASCCISTATRRGTTPRSIHTGSPHRSASSRYLAARTQRCRHS